METTIAGLKSYVGTKIINAAPMDSDTFGRLMDRPGLEVNQKGYLVIYPDGYKSWSPKAVFEEAYRPVSDKEFEMLYR